MGVNGDHLGNIRLSYKDADKDGAITQDEIVEEKNYYPFGLQHEGYNFAVNGSKHNYGFGCKEEQDELGLGWIDITARNYDPALGRWMNIDPLADQMRRHSPYNYAFDSPLMFIDPDGMAPFDVVVNGESSKEFVEQLNSSSSLSITRDSETGKLSATGEAKNEADKELLAAITDTNITVEVNAVDGFRTENDTPFIGGSFDGSKVKDDGTVSANQTANPKVLNQIDGLSGSKKGAGAQPMSLS